MTRPAHISYGGQVCFPGGKFDPDLDKSLSATALRETNEETGLAVTNLEIWGNVPTVPDRHGTSGVTAFVTQLSTPLDVSTLTPSPSEVDQLFTVPMETLLDESNFEFKTYNRGPENRPYHLPSYKIDQVEPDIWGLTAIKLNLVLHCMYGT